MAPLPLIGLIPAGGHATRIAPLPCSKEIFPVGLQRTATGALRPKAVCQYLLEKMRRAGANRTYIVLRKGKWDIPDYFGDGSELGMDLGYLIVRLPFGVPYTLDQAFPFVGDARVVFGFPDILFQPEDAFVQLLARQAATDADLVLGSFPTQQPHTADMVEIDEAGRVRNILIKLAQTDLRYAWINAVWEPSFTRFMHDTLIAAQTGRSDAAGLPAPSEELYLGHIIGAAIDQGLRIEAVTFPNGQFLDIGTPDNLERLVRSGGSMA